MFVRVFRNAIHDRWLITSMGVLSVTEIVAPRRNSCAAENVDEIRRVSRRGEVPLRAFTRNFPVKHASAVGPGKNRASCPPCRSNATKRERFATDTRALVSRRPVRAGYARTEHRTPAPRRPSGLINFSFARDPNETENSAAPSKSSRQSGGGGGGGSNRTGYAYASAGTGRSLGRTRVVAESLRGEFVRGLRRPRRRPRPVRRGQVIKS